MRALCATVVAALSTGAAAALAATPAPLTVAAPILRVADTTIGDDKTAPNPDAAPPGGPATAPPTAAPPPGSGRFEVQPGPQKPAQPPPPPNLNIPSPPATTPPATGPGPRATPPSERFEQHQEPAPRGQDPDALPRGEGAAMIPKEKPSAIKAVEDWVASWFE